jgi:hypothetical protein
MIAIVQAMVIKKSIAFLIIIGISSKFISHVLSAFSVLAPSHLKFHKIHQFGLFSANDI